MSACALQVGDYLVITPDFEAEMTHRLKVYARVPNAMWVTDAVVEVTRISGDGLSVRLLGDCWSVDNVPLSMARQMRQAWVEAERAARKTGGAE